MNLLIVDDNAGIRRLIVEFIQPFAGEIRECANGVDALSAYTARRPDLVLMDIRMNGVDGIEATRRMKTVDGSARIIIVTDYDDDALRQAASIGGASGYVLKDNLFDLIRLIQEMKQDT